MATDDYKRLTQLLAVTCVLLTGLCVWLFFQVEMLSIRMSWADEQTSIMEEMRVRALQSGVGEAAECLGYAVAYYPSGTKQVAGSKLDQVVERSRASVVRDIISYLRSKTGEDLGDDPKLWLRQE